MTEEIKTHCGSRNHKHISNRNHNFEDEKYGDYYSKHIQTIRLVNIDIKNLNGIVYVYGRMSVYVSVKRKKTCDECGRVILLRRKTI